MAAAPEKESIHVEYLGRQHLQVSAFALLPLHPSVVYAVITHPENEKIFRHLDHCSDYQVLERDDAHGRLLVESEHVATWRFLGLSGSVRSRLRIQQDHQQLISRFELVPGRFSLLRLFNGQWTVEAQPPGADGAPACLLRLQQQIRPAYFLPPPVGTVLKQLVVRQLQGIFEDLRQEAARISAGRPSLWRAGAAQGSLAAAALAGEPPEPPRTPDEGEDEEAAVEAEEQEAQN